MPEQRYEDQRGGGGGSSKALSDKAEKQAIRERELKAELERKKRAAGKPGPKRRTSDG